MKFICERDEILRQVSYAEGFVSSKTTIQILLNILLETKDDKVYLSATDFKLGIKTYINANIEKEGGITLNAKKLLDIIKSFPPTKLLFVLDDNDNVAITSSESKISTKYVLKGMPKDEYPTVKGFNDKTECFEIEQDILKRLINKTKYAIYKQEDRIFLNGIYFVKNGTNLKLVSTDGRRLAFYDYTLSEEGNLKKMFSIVPASILYNLLKILSTQGKCQIALSHDDNQIFFKVNEVELVSNLLEGKFPNYEQVIPQNSEYELCIRSLDLIEALKRSATMVDEKNYNITCILDENKLTIKSNNPDMGEFEETIEIENPKLKDFEVGFNVHYLIEAIREFDEAELIFNINDDMSPLKIVGKGNNVYLAVVMPIKVNKEN